MYRSTKGASKARRDQINAEIRNLKELLPISEADKARLSYLHIMSLACMYTRKSVFFSQEAAGASGQEETASLMSFHELSELVHGLPGFLMLLTSEGKLLYLSDSVSEHLGQSMVDLVAQGDNVYDIIDPSDHFVMRSNLVPTTAPDTDRLFRCRFSTSKSARRQSGGNKLALIRARCLSPPSTTTSYWTSNPVWMCFCSPLDVQPQQPCPAREPVLTPPTDHAFFLACFRSQHSQDMRVQEAQDSVTVYLGYDVETLRTRSWYSLVHPEDLSHASAQHCRLLSEGAEGRVEMVVRVEAADHTWVWLYMVLQLETGERPICCYNYVISESEAWSVRQQLCTEQNQLALVLSASASYQESLGLQSPDTLSSPDQVFTPGSSGLSVQSFDFGSGVEQGAVGGDPAQQEGTQPRSSLSSLEEESSSQQGQPPPQHHSQDPQPGDSSSYSPPLPDPNSELDFFFLPPPMHTGLQLTPPPFQVPATPPAQPQSELACTPPYTPQMSVGNFLFGERFFPSDGAGSGSNYPTSTPTSHTQLLSFSTPEFLPSMETCSGAFHEKLLLLPTPDSPDDDDNCTVMTLPEVRGPLFVDIPGGTFCPPEGLLTPEASPGKLSRCSLEEQQERDRETEGVSLLAQHISSLAEQFYPDSLFHKLCPPTSPVPSPPPLVQEPMDEFYPIKHGKGLEVPVPVDDIALIEECILEALLQELSSPFPLPCSPPAPPQFEGASLSGFSRFCSVQSAQCNPAARGGATAAAQPGAIEAGMEMEVTSLSSSLSPAAPAAPSPRLLQPLLEELVAPETMFGADVPITPALGQQPELYQLNRHSPPQSFHQGGSGSDPPF